MHAINTTHELLIAYAATRYTLTVAGTIPQLTSWYGDFAGIRIPERTFKLHTRHLRDAGLIEVRHTKKRTYYTLLDFEVEMPRVKFLPTSTPGQFMIEESGDTDTVSYARIMAEPDRGMFNRNLDPTDGGPEHGEVMRSLECVGLPF